MRSQLLSISKSRIRSARDRAAELSRMDGRYANGSCCCTFSPAQHFSCWRRCNSRHAFERSSTVSSVRLGRVRARPSLTRWSSCTNSRCSYVLGRMDRHARGRRGWIRYTCLVKDAPPAIQPPRARRNKIRAFEVDGEAIWSHRSRLIGNGERLSDFMTMTRLVLEMECAHATPPARR